jgi:hypothetical protein
MRLKMSSAMVVSIWPFVSCLRNSTNSLTVIYPSPLKSILENSALSCYITRSSSRSLSRFGMNTACDNCPRVRSLGAAAVSWSARALLEAPNCCYWAAEGAFLSPAISYCRFPLVIGEVPLPPRLAAWPRLKEAWFFGKPAAEVFPVPVYD